MLRLEPILATFLNFRTRCSNVPGITMAMEQLPIHLRDEPWWVIVWICKPPKELTYPTWRGKSFSQLLKGWFRGPEGYKCFCPQLPRFGPIPDLRRWLQTYAFWSGGGNSNIAKMVRSLVFHQSAQKRKNREISEKTQWVMFFRMKKLFLDK